MFETRQSGGFLSNIPPVTLNLLIINIALWLICSFMPSFGQTIYNTLGLHYWGASVFNPIQPITYMFLQAPMGSGAGLGHIFFNMFALYMFGRILEMTWGAKRFLFFYMACGIGAALVQEIVWLIEIPSDYLHILARRNGITTGEMQAMIDASPVEAAAAMKAFSSRFLTIGASGAVFGLLLGFGCTFPNVPMYLFFIPVPIKAKFLVAGYAVLELFFGMSGTLSSVAHYAHLGGMLFALPIILYWNKKGTLHGGRS
ncbi:MAG: rhomboid family intramembrane serine protease [Prevotella sp.]|nr:rhomboid family intramembrane serine protease [Prevotella sp.]MCM1074227.1 rhomboid family intramembrane serine protease [Ruminococcus sp.]